VYDERTKNVRVEQIETVEFDMKNGSYLTIGQAAKETGKAKSTIKKAIDNGDLSVAEKTSRGFKIDASELFRVFPRKTIERSQSVRIEQTETVENSKEIQALERTLKVMEDQLEDVKADRDEWRKQANQLLLSAPTARKKFLGIF